MPPDGSRPEEAPSRISREMLPGSIQEGRVIERTVLQTAPILALTRSAL